MSEPRIAAQLYTVRQHVQDPAGLAESLRKISAIGYTGVQVSGIGPIPDAEVKQMAEDNGLVICITHASFEELWNKPDDVIARHRLWGCRHVALGMMPKSYREQGEDGYRQFAAEGSRVGERLAAGGLTFSYHNHHVEFVRFGRRTGLDLLYEESDPRYLKAEPDTYWIQYGGGDPAAWIRKLAGRTLVVHVKDMVIIDDRIEMAEIGEGNLNWPAILGACRVAGAEWCAVEQDECRRDPFESLAISYRNLHDMGLV